MNVAAWLCGLGLEQYIQTFTDNDIDGQTLRMLTESDLFAMGVVSVGHKRRLLAAIADLPADRADPADIVAPIVERQAERRQLSILYCDMVGSTALSERLDPEAYREVIRLFHDRCVRTVAEYDGWIANFIGDCVLAYFGWPHAHEDDPDRAVRTGLALVKAAAAIGTPVRVGIATGPVVVGALIRSGPAQEQSAVGMTPDLAAHLQALAEPGQVLIDELTRCLAPNFAVRPLHSATLDGIRDPAPAYMVTGEQQADSRFHARVGQEVTPMVGRDRELSLLMERWAQARDGEGLAVLLVGEAGIGKSRLARAMLDACAANASRVRWQCSPYHMGSPLWPMAQALSRTADLQSEDSTDAALDKLEAVVGERGASALHAALLGLNGAQRYGPLQMTPQMLRERTLEVIIEQLFEMAERQPLLLVVEDAHWIDPTTLELIEYCLGRIDSARMLVLLTSRPDNQPSLATHPCVTRLSLNRLNRSSVEEIVARMAGSRLKPQTLAAIAARSDGVPLFVEELTKAVLETGESAIPASLIGSLMARLDRLPEAKEVAQVAACIGREFDLALLQAVSDEPEAVGPAIDKLLAAELVFPRGERSHRRFSFKHALVQETARASLLHKRREAIHTRILGALEAQRPDVPKEVLAHHAAAAGQADKAMVHWSDAGKAAQTKSAYMEAATFLERAIELIQAQSHARSAGPSAGPDLRALELDLQVRLGQCRLGFYGFGSHATRQAYQRAKDLTTVNHGDRPVSRMTRLQIQYGLWVGHYIRGELQEALVLGQEMMAAEELDGTPESLLIARRMVGTSAQYLGEFAMAQVLYDEAMPLVDSVRCGELGFPADPRITMLHQYSLQRCLQGHADHSRQVMERAYGLCTPETTAFQRAYLHLATALRSAFERDGAAVAVELDRLADLFARHRMLLGFVGYIDSLAAWSASDGNPPVDEAIARARRGLDQLEESGVRLYVPFFMARLADDLSASRRDDEATAMMDRAFALCKETGQGWCEAELWRVRGELALRLPRQDPSLAGDCYTKALMLSRLRGAKLWELRACVSLARLLARQEQPTKALEVLAPVCEWFPGDAHTADLADARTLLDDLRYCEKV